MPVLGGAHGDVPLQAPAGALLADVVVDAGVQTVVLDPVGAWWGLRSPWSSSTRTRPVFVFPAPRLARMAIASPATSTGKPKPRASFSVIRLLPAR